MTDVERIRQADDKAFIASVAFVTGKFDKYLEKEYGGILDELDRITAGYAGEPPATAEKKVN